jgi:hypothetical protein
MSIKQADYEILLSEYSNRAGAIALLKRHRPYLEMIPSMRRATESLISIPLPLIRIRDKTNSTKSGAGTIVTEQVIELPCDLALLMCDPEWKIKIGVEILIFIHRPLEEFSDLLSRWRKSQILLHKEYEWLMPASEEHMFSEPPEHIHPLFVVFEETPERIKRGLIGASLPFIVESPDLVNSEKRSEVLSAQE